jgi:putative DNA primase/helicase
MGKSQRNPDGRKGPKVFLPLTLVQMTLGLITGDASRIVDIDIDNENALNNARHFLPPTGLRSGRALSPNSHWFYNVVESDRTVQRQTADLGMIVELRGNGSQTMIPPSIHPDGESVEFTSFGHAAQVEWAVLHDRVDELAIATVIGPYWTKGCRHHLCLALLGVLRRAGWAKDRSEGFIKAIVKAFGDEELSDRLECVETTYSAKLVNGHRALVEIIGEKNWQSISKWLGCSERPAPERIGPIKSYKSEVVCAEAFSEHLRGKLLYSDFHEGWFERTNGVYVPISDVGLQSLVLDFGKDLEKSIHLSELTTFQSSGKVTGIVRLSRSLLKVAGTEFDTDNDLLGCQNGVLDLRTGQLLKAPETVVTKRIATVYDPEAKCPQFLKFLEVIFEGNREVINYVKRCIGYSLQGNVKEQCLFLCIGSGRNGKSTLLNAVGKLMGDYAGALPTAALMDGKNGNNNTYDIANLIGKRLVVFQEGEATNKLAEARVKLLTGGDKISARQIYGKPEEFWPNHKLWFGTNELPRIDGINEAIWRRLKNVIRFPVYIEDSKVDYDLGDKLTKEMSGILNFAIEGYKDWITQGLNPPDSVLREWSDYRNQEDTVEGFIDACCIKDGKTMETTADLHSHYVDWCNNSGCAALSKPSFGKALGIKGYKGVKGRLGNGWIGLRLMKPDEQSSQMTYNTKRLLDIEDIDDEELMKQKEEEAKQVIFDRFEEEV